MLVSVIIPTCNREELLKEAIESVKAQVFQDFELIVIEDKEQKGPAQARNQGVAKAKGRYVAFLDSDDLWDKRKLEKQLDHLQKNPEYKICYTNERWEKNGKYLNQMKKHQKYGGWIFDKCLPLCIISCSSILIEREVFNQLGGFDESFPVCEDYELWLRMSLKYPIAYLNEKLIVKRGGHRDQLSKKYWGMDRFRVRAIEKLLRFNLTLEQRRLAIEELKKKCGVLISGAHKRHKYFRWLYYQWKTFRLK